MKFIKSIFLSLLLGALWSKDLVHCKYLKSWKSEEITLDLDGKYKISWEVDDKRERVTFDVTVQTTGYIGLGISPNGGMKGADFFIGGVDNQGNHYHSDRHLPIGSNNSQPLEDVKDDWTVLAAKEVNGTTTLRFSRLLNTCDEQDYPITEDDTVRLIWAFGSSDELSYHGTQRGSTSLNIIESEEAAEDISGLSQWKMTINSSMPGYETSYWCTIHKRPNLDSVNHIVGFDAYLEENTLAKRHTHHFIIYKCTVPNGVNAEEIFEPHVGGMGEECYGESARLPKTYCREYLFVWAVGGKPTWFPKDVGYPIAESKNESPYYMMEIHYDNPESLENVSFETGVVIYHTTVLRNQKAGLLTVGVDPRPSLTIPPNEPDFIVAGHCGDACTNHFPSSGISVFNILLHSHFSGRQLKLRHFRNGIELPWMLSDASYDFNFQQNKPIKEHIKVLAGDHLTYECNYDTTWNDNKIVYGGLSTRSEMCQTFLWYYPRTDIEVCGSTYNFEQNFKDFGITKYNMTFTASGEENPIIVTPKEMEGLNYTTALSTKFEWSEKFRKDFQENRRFGTMEVICVDRSQGNPIAEGYVKYPNRCADYIPDDKCTNEDESVLHCNSAEKSRISSALILFLISFVTFQINW